VGFPNIFGQADDLVDELVDTLRLEEYGPLEFGDPVP
jgi:hypothetical protein